MKLKLKNINWITAITITIIFLIIAIPTYVAYKKTLVQSLISESKSTANIITELRSIYTTEVVGRASKECTPAMSIYKGIDGAIPLPATLSILLGERLTNGKYEGAIKLYSKYPFPWRQKTGGLRDEFSMHAWDFLTQFPDSSYYEINDNNIRYATGDIMKKGCINCHNTTKGTPKTDWKLNDLRGVLEIKKKTAPIIKKTRTNFLISGMLIFLFSIILVYGLRRFFIKWKKENSHNQKLANDLTNLKFAIDKTAIIGITDNKGVIKDVNQKFCEISGYSKKELIGKTHRLINSSHHPKQFFKEMWGSISNKKIWQGEVLNINKKGEHYWVDSTIIPLLDEQGEIMEYIAIRFEITERKKAEEKIKEQNKDLENFAFIVSHDLKAPLRGISTLADFIKEDLGEVLPDDVSNNITLLKNRVHRMNSLINGVLNFSKHTLEKSVIKENVSIQELAKTIVNDLTIPENTTIQIEQNLPVISGDRIQLSQVFTNLIWNAIKYNDKPEAIIQVGHKISNNNKYVFFVKDNGPGISSEYHEKVFVIFQTLEGRDQNDSTGVGLAIVKKIIESMGGKIWIESDAKNGTTFFFEISKT